MFNNMKLGVKLIGIFTIVFVFVTAMMLSGAAVRMKALRMLDTTYRQYVDDVKACGNLKIGLENMEKDIYLYAIVPSERANIQARINEQLDSIDKLLQAYKDKKRDSEELKFLSEFDAAWPAVKGNYKAILTAADNGNNAEVTSLSSEGSSFGEAKKKVFSTVNGLNAYNISRHEAAVKKYIKGRGGWSGILWLFSALGAFLLVIFGVFTHRGITQPISKIVTMMKEIEKGHLSHRLNLIRKDEIGSLSRSIDMFADHIQKNIVFSMQQISEGNIDVKPEIVDEKDELGPTLNKMIDAVGSMSKEIERCFHIALEGNLQNRADVTLYQGIFQKIMQGYNDTLDAFMRPISEASVILKQIAEKDMTVRMIGDYKGDHAQIKESINLVVENLDRALQQVAIGADQVAAASVQVSTGGQALSQGASEQASSLEEISSSLQEMSSMTKQNALNAREANGVAGDARVSAQKGVESMNKMSGAIEKIKTSSDSTAKIVKTIDEIAFQTNLLALNAAVEAARAGDAGKGFAVVAEEVRNLAMRSAEAAKNTANLIEEAVKNSENGVVINTEVLTNFQEITEKINKVSQVVAEIAAASDQQDQGITQVNKAVEQMNQLTQQNAANAEESASAAQEMSSQSEEMRSMVAGFKLNGSEKSGHVLLEDKKSNQVIRNVFTGKKGGKALAGLHPDPRKVIPLDESDQKILTTF